jgi:hypothetical protein
MAQLVGLYTEPQIVVEHPGYFDALIDTVGLTHILMAGYILSPETRAKNPLPPGHEASVPTPGSDDDRALRRALDIAHGKGLQVWIRGWGWHGYAGRYPSMCMQDMHGRPLSEVPQLRYGLDQYAIAFCPNHEGLNEWFRSAYSDMIANYDVEGLNLSHCRYTAPSFLHNLLGCACARCQAVAREQGYDFERMRGSALAFWDRLHHLDASTVRRANQHGWGLMGLSEWLGIDVGLVDWFSFRARVLTDRLRFFKQAVLDAGGTDVVFGTDTFPPSFSMLVGHNYRDFLTWSGYTSPLISHVEIFILATFASYADLLCQWNPGLDETDVLQLVYRLFGYDHLDLPQTLEGLGVGTPDLEAHYEKLYDIVSLELSRARLYNDGSIPSYPVIKGGTWPKQTVQRLMQTAEALGHDGIILQGTESLLEYPGI